MAATENDFSTVQPRKRRISTEEFKKATEALIGWRVVMVISIVLVGIFSCFFCDGIFMHRPEELWTIGPMVIGAGLIYWLNRRALQLAQLIMDYENQQP